MDNTRYYNDSLAHDFALFMPKEKEKITTSTKRSSNKGKTDKSKKVKETKRGKKTNKNKDKNPVAKAIISAIVLMAVCICYLSFMAFSHESKMAEVNSQQTYSSIIDIYEKHR